MPITSNIDDVGRWLSSVVNDFSWDEEGINESMGYDAAFAVAEGIAERSDKEQKGARDQWPENSEPYKSRKGRKYGTEKTNYRTGQMESIESMTANLGSIDGGKTFVMQYGTGQAPTGSPNGYIENKDKLVTDTEKATYAHESERPFFQVDQEIANDKVKPVLEDGFSRYLKKRAHS